MVPCADCSMCLNTASMISFNVFSSADFSAFAHTLVKSSDGRIKKPLSFTISARITFASSSARRA